MVICIDGCADEYLSTSIAQGRMPNVHAMARNGYRGLVRAALPTFTNVNNASIVTGVAPSQTGICGNFFLNPETGEEVMMNAPEFLRCETILTAAARAGRRVAFITAKEKLRTVLGTGLVDLGGIAFSSEKADEVTETTHGVTDLTAAVGRRRPEIYSGDASIYVLQAGNALLRKGRADWLYLSLTDYMQHKYAPDAPESLEFYGQIDFQIGQMLEQGAIVAATADHGMNAKNKLDGSPNVIYLQTLLDREFPDSCRVICPITDPYVVHHGALGSLVMVHLNDPAEMDAVRQTVDAVPGITEVYTRADACRKLQLASDRIGDLVVMSGRDIVIGRRPEDHDLSVLAGGLRSHGGRYEEMVPMLLSEPMGPKYHALSEGDPRNFDVFSFACNGNQ